ncbi:hypothetical protein AAMO2058_001072900 [Amorphochlora amoebiformis]
MGAKVSHADEKKLDKMKICQRHKEEALKDKRVKFMIKSMAAFGCPIPQHDFIRCEREPPGGQLVTGAFDIGDDKERPKVILYANNLQPTTLSIHTIRHELVHALDYCKYDVDKENMKHVACTEVRAASLSGECDASIEFLRSYSTMSFNNHHKRCVRRRSAKSLQYSFDASEKQIKDTLDSVFNDCYADTSPFGIIP